ncbi:hypothetical protein AUJ84_03640 [Candidatus Pacearchaeota archaeon CG1_02_32_132]|nr:MAG: hypothetical protein AUJ84_03640 [Candidatus Pacearchaeota archaeon CG1_02_32_132]
MDLTKELKLNMKENSGYLIASNQKLYKKVIDELTKPFRKVEIDKVVAIESKGFLYGSTISYKLNKPFIPLFKSGRVPKKYVLSKKYKDYSHKIKSLDIGKISIHKGDRVLIVDDAFETGQSGKAAIELVEKLGGMVIGISIIYSRLKEKDEKLFKKYNLKSLLKISE